MMKNLLKYTVFALIVGTITVIFQLDGMTKTVISKGLFIAFSVADKCLADNNGGGINWAKWSRKRLVKIVGKMPKYVVEGLV